jgi:molybdopterin-guanine dinucleotide biosynthesis protein A
MKTNGFVLAGGKSTRMGRDKALLDWRGITLLDHMKKLLAGAADEVHVIGREDLPDRLPEHGPMGGILTALEISHTDTNLVVGVDLPLLTSSFLKYMRFRLQDSNHLGLACNIRSQFPLCLGLRRAALSIARRRVETGELSVHGFLEECRVEIISEAELGRCGFDSALFQNVNTASDFQLLLRAPQQSDTT